MFPGFYDVRAAASNALALESLLYRLRIFVFIAIQQNVLRIWHVDAGNTRFTLLETSAQFWHCLIAITVRVIVQVNAIRHCLNILHVLSAQ